MQEKEAKTEERILVLSLLGKLREQIEITQKMIGLIPPDCLAWRPVDYSFRVGDLLGHMLECLAGFCAAFYAMHPDKLSHFQSLRELQVNHYCSIEEAQRRIAEYQTYIEEGFAALHDTDLAMNLSTVFVNDGETAMNVLLSNFEHFINHKYQFYFYLKLLGVRVTTETLYHFRG